MNLQDEMNLMALDQIIEKTKEINEIDNSNESYPYKFGSAIAIISFIETIAKVRKEMFLESLNGVKNG